MPTLANGYTVTFSPADGGATFSPQMLTRVTLNRNGSSRSRQRVSIAHLNEPYTETKTINNVSTTVRREEPYVEIWQPRGDAGGAGSLEIEYLGALGILSVGKSGTLTVTGSGLAYASSYVTVASSQMTLAVGDVMRGSCGFSLPASTSTATCNC